MPLFSTNDNLSPTTYSSLNRNHKAYFLPRKFVGQSFVLIFIVKNKKRVRRGGGPYTESYKTVNRFKRPWETHRHHDDFADFFLNQEIKWAKVYLRLGGCSLFERSICRVNWPLLGQLLTLPAVGYSYFVYKNPSKYNSNHRLSLYNIIRGLS